MSEFTEAQAIATQKLCMDLNSVLEGHKSLMMNCSDFADEPGMLTANCIMCAIQTTVAYWIHYSSVDGKEMECCKMFSERLKEVMQQFLDRKKEEEC